MKMKNPKYRTPVIAKPDLLEIVETFDIFKDIPLGKIDAFIDALSYDIEKYSSGSLILDSNNHQEFFGFILEGEVKMESAFNEKTIKKGDDIALISALSTSKVLAKKYIAQTDCTILWTKLDYYLLTSHFVSMHCINFFDANLLKILADELL